MEMEGEVFSTADLGAVMSLTLNADGTAESFDGETTSTDTWRVENGAVVMTDMVLTLDAEGQLVAEMDGVKLIFAKSGEAAAPAAPAGDASAYLGTWHADTLEMEGEVYPVAAMGLEMYFTLNADGTAESFDGETTENGSWVMENGVVLIDGVAVELTGDGRLLMADADSKLYFVKGDAAAAPAEPAAPVEPAPAAPSGDASAYLGAWRADILEMEGEAYPVAEMGLAMTFTLNADGTAESYDGETSETGTWTLEGSTVLLDGMPMTMDDQGRLVMEEEDMKLIFVRDDGTVAPAAPVEPAASAEPEASTSSAIDLSSRMDVRYVCVNAEASGITMDASMLGGEYSLTLHADGTADFVMVGTPVPGLKWTQNGDVITVDYYGTLMDVYLTDAGLDMNYFDAMLLHLVPAE